MAGRRVPTLLANQLFSKKKKKKKATMEGAGRPRDSGSEHATCNLDGLTTNPQRDPPRIAPVGYVDQQHSPLLDVRVVLGASFF